MNSIFKLIIKFYQKLVSPFLAPRCRFYPTCSEYSKICFETLPFHLALWYSISRIVKCHPYNDGGFDPPPVEKRCC